MCLHSSSSLVGYLFALGPLLFVTIFDVWLERFTTKQSYVINLMSMGTVAFGCTGICSYFSFQSHHDCRTMLGDCPFFRLTLCCQPFPAITVWYPISSTKVQQSSFYGYMGMLPKHYTQGVMTGESKRLFAHENPCLCKMQKLDFHSLFFFCIGTAGVIISLSRIFTKLLIKNERESTIIFFVISICMVLLCFVLHVLVRKTRFVRYYTGLARRGLSHAKDHSQNGTQYQVHHDVITEEVRLVSFACQIWERHIIMNLFTAFLQ